MDGSGSYVPPWEARRIAHEEAYREAWLLQNEADKPRHKRHERTVNLAIDDSTNNSKKPAPRLDLGRALSGETRERRVKVLTLIRKGIRDVQDLATMTQTRKWDQIRDDIRLFKAKGHIPSDMVFEDDVGGRKRRASK